MSIRDDEVNEVRSIIKELEQLAEKRIRTEERFNIAKNELLELGYESIEEAEKDILVIRGKVDKKLAKLKNDFNDFKDDFGELF